MSALYLVVEGHGDEAAGQNLVTRLWTSLGLESIEWRTPIRGVSIASSHGVERACGVVRARGDAAAMLILRDEDDRCPRDVAPQIAALVAKQGLPFASAVVLLHREFETLFLPCLDQIAGKALVQAGIKRPGLRPRLVFEGDPESKRGVKEWLAANSAPGGRYKPTLDQLPMTRLLDFGVLRAAGLPCFGTLERALTFVSVNRGQPRVYPPPAAR